MFIAIKCPMMCSSYMHEREIVILNVFANWAVNCHREIKAAYEKPIHEKHINELTQNVKDAFLKKDKYDFFINYETEYYAALYQYVLYGLHYGKSFYLIQRDRIERFEYKWSCFIRTLSQSKNTLNAIDLLLDDLDTSLLMYDILDKHDDELHLLELTDFQRLILEYKAEQYEGNFGAKLLFEKAGRHFVENIFSEMTKPKGRPKRNSNLDTFRAFQFGRLLKKINTNLVARRMQRSTTTEVCELIFSDKNKCKDHVFQNEIDWVLKDYFKIKNVTVRAILNSISRGKTMLSKNEIRDFYDSQ